MLFELLCEGPLLTTISCQFRDTPQYSQNLAVSIVVCLKAMYVAESKKTFLPGLIKTSLFHQWQPRS